MDNQNYAAQFYSDISVEPNLLERNIEEYPASSVVHFMWLYHLKKNNDLRFEEVAKQAGIYLTNPLWMEYQLYQSVLADDAVNKQISNNFVSENESSETKNTEAIVEAVEEIKNENPVDSIEPNLEEEDLPTTVNQQISQNSISENESSETKNSNAIVEPVEEIKNENPVDLIEPKPEGENLPTTVNEQISQNPILENESSEIKNDNVIAKTFDEIKNEDGVDSIESKSEEENLPTTVNEQISQNSISENESSETKNDEAIVEPVEEIENEDTVDSIEPKSEGENLPATVNEQISQNPISENESSETKNDEAIAEPIEEIPGTDRPDIEHKSSEEIQTSSNETCTKDESGEDDTTIPFEPLHTVDYFASQGIKLSEEALANDQLGKQVKSFTAWLKTMKKLHPGQLPEQNEVIEKIIQSSSEESNQNANVLTEAMADVLVKQGKCEKAVEMYEKLSLINPSKSAYFAAKIENLKTV